MLGKRSDQRALFEADHLYLDFVGRDSFYGFLASQRGKLFRDEDFAKLYCLDNGCPSVPPSLLATALLLQTYDRVSDEEAKARADFDLRWKVALGIELDSRPFAKSTLQLFRAQLIINDEVGAVFKKSLAFARQSGHLKNRKIKAALDTSNILGRGAVKDTYNLLADGIVKLVGVLAELAGYRPEQWAKANDLARYFATTSLKGAAEIDWADAKARRKFLGRIVADADRLLEMARQALSGHAPESPAHEKLTEAAELLGQLLLQDVERKPDGPAIKEGVSRDRVISVHDPEMRHGRKSAAKRFDGHKAALAVDTETQLITAVAVLAGNAQDNEQALELVEQSEQNAEVEVEETIGDCAYGDGATRQRFVDAGRKLVAKVPDRPNGAQIPKEDFRIDLDQQTCTCPAGQECRTLVPIGVGKDLQARVDAANSAGADLFLSIHNNGHPDPGESGSEVWYDPGRSFGDRNLAFAKLALTGIVQRVRGLGYPVVERGVKDDSNFRIFQGRAYNIYVLGAGSGPRAHTPTQMPGVLGESLFLSNPGDAAMLRKPATLDAIAAGYRDAIVAYFEKYPD